ncbi:hypothetical protein DPEC_G00087680 [Dallia pectoralis]|uniref:Uncharacterized protein n=1 Tax=Dallia pectoralis TaxID=75939 RepID=A0ACC2H0S1_DALPE|nr:hypothetical protein DPEC_G00087680 [Dallia pectoralis]
MSPVALRVSSPVVGRLPRQCGGSRETRFPHVETIEASEWRHTTGLGSHWNTTPSEHFQTEGMVCFSFGAHRSGHYIDRKLHNIPKSLTSHYNWAVEHKIPGS